MTATKIALAIVVDIVKRDKERDYALSSLPISAESQTINSDCSTSGWKSKRRSTEVVEKRRVYCISLKVVEYAMATQMVLHIPASQSFK